MLEGMPHDLFDLIGESAVVTGGSGALDQAMVVAIAERGVDVVVAGRQVDAPRELAEEVPAS